MIDLVDVKTHQIVFRGVGNAKVRSEKENAANIQWVVTKIVAVLPALGRK